MSSSLVLAPTGIRADVKINGVDIYWASNDESNIQGYNLYRSTTSGGDSDTGYTKVNTTIINHPLDIEERIVGSQKTVEEEGNIDRTVNGGFLYRTTTTEDTIDLIEHQNYSDNVSNDPSSIIAGVTYYYVVTAVINNGTENIESSYSEEIEATPMSIPVYLDYPTKTANEIALTTIQSALTYDPEIDVSPGKVFRDVLVDFPSAEMARIYLIQKFFNISQSYISLIELDDADNDGISDRFVDNEAKRTYKTVFGFSTDAAMQSMIDYSFDRLAYNSGITRIGATKATGTATLYTTSSFTKDLIISAGTRIASIADSSGSTIVFVTLATKTMYYSFKNNYYNASTKRWEINIPIEAEIAGANGNVSAGSIKQILSNLSLSVVMQVTNNYRTTGGQDTESNNHLAERGMLAYVGVDPGTKYGYKSTMLSLPLVQTVYIIEAGNAIMMRDYDDVRQKHIGGKVDIYERGESLLTHTDTYEFFYKEILAQQLINTDVSNLIFNLPSGNVVSEGWDIVRVISIINMTNNAIYYEYGDTTLTIVGDTLQLDPSAIPNPSDLPNTLDEILITYWYSASNNYITQYQPVNSISSLSGDSCGNLFPTTDLWDASGNPISGAPSAAGYLLWKIDDPLWLGESTQASDQVRIYPNWGLPTGNLFSTTDEIILEGTKREYLTKVGVILGSIVVVGKDSGISFDENIDYTVIPGTSFVTDGESTAPQLERIVNGNIASGEVLNVTYSHYENMTLEYLVNSLISTGQELIDGPKNKCVTADVLIKQAHDVPIDIISYISFKDGYDPDTIKYRIQDNLQNFFSTKKQGDSVYQSEVIEIMQATEGVSYVRQPLEAMHRADGGIRVRELIDATFTPYSTGTVICYKTPASALNFPTQENGGPINLFRGIFQESEELTFVENSTLVDSASSQSYIGTNGTVYVSLRYGTLINSYDWYATYYVYGDTGTKDMILEELEYPTLNNLAIFEI